MSLARPLVINHVIASSDPTGPQRTAASAAAAAAIAAASATTAAVIFVCGQGLPYGIEWTLPVAVGHLSTIPLPGSGPIHCRL